MNNKATFGSPFLWAALAAARELQHRACSLRQGFACAFASAFACAFAFAVATRLAKRRECPSQKAERRCCYGGGAAGRRASRDGPWMPVDPLRRTSTRPADGASRSKSKARSKAAEAADRPVWMRDLRTTGGLDRQQSFYRVICLPQVTANANPSYFNSPSLLDFTPSILLADLDA